MKSIFKSKTFYLAIAQMVLGMIVIIEANYPEVRTLGGVAIAKSFIDILLRYLSTQEVTF